MKRLFLATVCSVPCILYNTTNLCVNTVTFFLCPYPSVAREEAAKLVASKLGKPGKLAKYTMTSGLDGASSVGGIFSTYAGYLAASDFNGRTTFPLRHDKPKFYLLITSQIFPVIMFGVTIHHWERVADVPAALYEVERKKDEETSSYYWQMKKIPLPEEKNISKKAIVIFADPRKIYVPEGITPTSDNSHLVLPDIYVKKALAKVPNALYVLTIRNFFSTTGSLHQESPLRHITHVSP